MDDSSFCHTYTDMYSSNTLLSSGRSIVYADQSRQSVNHPHFKLINTFDKPLTIVDMINTPAPDGVRIVNGVQIIRELHLPFLHMITLPVITSFVNDMNAGVMID